MSLRLAVPTLCCLVLAAASGCELPAQIFWAPDGSRAVYVPGAASESPAALIDANGAIIATLGRSTGGCAWAADSRVMYFAARVEKTAAPAVAVRYEWCNVAAEQLPPVEEDAKEVTAVSVWNQGVSTPLFHVDDQMVWYMTLSPDQQWLAVVAYKERKDRDDQLRLYVYSVRTGRLYLLSVACQKGVCFTGPARLAFVEPGKVRHGVSSDSGALVEVELDADARTLERQHLAYVLPSMTSWLAALGEDVLLTTMPITLPMAQAEEIPPRRLYRYQRKQQELTTLAQGVGDLFMPSPDGRLVLIEKLSREQGRDSERSELAVIETASGRLHVLKIDGQPVTLPPSGMGMYPNWRGPRQIAAAALDGSRPPREHGGRRYYEVMLYEIAEDFTLKPLRLLSENWPLEMKPSVKLGPAPERAP